MMRGTDYQTRVQVGGFWLGENFVLCKGSRWYCIIRAKMHLLMHPVRLVKVEPAD